MSGELAVKEALLSAESLAEIASAAALVVARCVPGGKLLIFGNGGSAADAQHIAGESSGGSCSTGARCRRSRSP